MLSSSVARLCAAFVSLALVACNLFDTSGIGNGASSIGTTDTTVGTTTIESTTGAADSTTSANVDSGSDSSSSTGGSGGGPGPLGPFASPIAITVLNSVTSDIDPTLRADQREILFASDRGGDFDIYTSTRASEEALWQDPQRSETLTSPAGETSPEISSDGLVLTFASDISGEGALDLFVSTRVDTSSDWATAVNISELNTIGADVSASLTTDHLEVFLCASFSGNLDIYRATRADANDSWLPPVALAELNTRANECAPFVDVSGTWLLFTSNRPGGMGGDDIWGALRDHEDEPFMPLLPVVGINGAGDDLGPWVSPELDVLYFARQSDAGDFDLHMARREAD